MAPKENASCIMYSIKSKRSWNTHQSRGKKIFYFLGPQEKFSANSLKNFLRIHWKIFCEWSSGQTRKHCCANTVSYQCFAMFPNVGKHLETLVRNIGKHQMFLNSIGNIFASREANFVSATMFPRVGKPGNIWGNIENHKCFHNNVS
jgi:hypothetical protein